MLKFYGPEQGGDFAWEHPLMSSSSKAGQLVSPLDSHRVLESDAALGAFRLTEGGSTVLDCVRRVQRHGFFCETHKLHILEQAMQGEIVHESALVQGKKQRTDARISRSNQGEGTS
jgi:hypothetical protein